MGIILAIFSARENKDGYFFKDSRKSGFGRVVLVIFFALFLLIGGFIVILLEDWLIAAFPVLGQPIITIYDATGSVRPFIPQFPGATWVSWVIVGNCIWIILNLMVPDANPIRSVGDIFGHFFLPTIYSSVFVIMGSLLVGSGFVEVEVAKILGGVATVAFVLVWGLIAVLFITAFNLFISLFNN